MQDVIIKGENSLTTIQIVDTPPHGQMLVGIYNDDVVECSIRILLYDFMKYGQFIHEDFDNVVYIDDFECKDQLKGRGRGRKLLFTVLNHIRTTRGKKTYVTLTVSSKSWVPDGNDEALMRYYNQLGFQELEKMIQGLMYANIETVMKKCSPREFQPLPEPSPEAAAAAVAAAAPLARVQPREVHFSSSEEYPISSVSSSHSLQSSRSSDSRASRVRDTSVPPSNRSDVEGGGKKNHTNKKYTMKTRKNKKSKKRWSLKYKKSINCKRPRGFSQRQYCKYGRKKS